jgi:NADH-quinone oxidoreductase subunit L
MVTAGIYMIARSNVLYSMSEISQQVIQVISIATIMLAATIALAQNDIKKVLAYSTVSQLGYMFLGLGVGAYTGAVFHVMTHAFFKALLFLGAGSVIHAMGGEQDIRKMGGLKKFLPSTHWTFLVGCIAISGVPPFSGFFSKDEILAAAYNRSPVLWGFGVAGAFLTAFYMFRLYATTFLGNFRGTHDQEHHLHESPSAITIPLIILAILSVIGGFVNIPSFMPFGNDALHNFLAPVLTTEKINGAADTGHEYMLMGISVLLALAGIFLARSRYSKGPDTGEYRGINKFFANKWYVDEIYDGIIVRPINAFAGFLKNVVEKSGIDGFVNGVGRFVQYSSRQLRLLQSGLAGNYILFMVLSIVVLFLIFWNQIQIVQFLEKIF